MKRRTLVIGLLGVFLWMVTPIVISGLAVNIGNVCLASASHATEAKNNVDVSLKECTNFWVKQAVRWEDDNDEALGLGVWLSILDGDVSYPQLPSVARRRLLTYRLLSLANSQINMKNTTAALQYSSAAVVISPELADAHWALAELLIATGEWQKATEHYKILVQLRPSDIWPYIRLGQEAQIRKEYSEAADWYLKAVQVDSSSEFPYIYLSRTYYLLERYHDAELSARNALILNPVHPSAHTALVQALLQQDFTQNAANEYVTAAKLFVSLGKHAEACDIYSRALVAANERRGELENRLNLICP